MNRKKFLVILESPLQVMSFIEAIERFDVAVEDTYLIINKNSLVAPNNFKIMQSVFSFFNFELTDFNLTLIDIHCNFKGILKSRVTITALGNKFSEKGINYGFIGEYRSLLAQYLCNYCSVEKTIVLDDGNAVRRLPKERSVPSYFFNLDSIKKVLLSAFGFKIGLPNVITYFSAFLKVDDLLFSTDKLVRNEFIHLNKILLCSEPLNDEGIKLGLVGAPLSAAGVCSVDNESKALSALLDIALNSHDPEELIYFPHRRESEAKLRAVRERCIKVDEREIPIEIKLLDYKKLELMGFYSSCFDTIPLIFKSVNITAVRLKNELIDCDWREFVNQQYKNYSFNTNVRVFMHKELGK